MSTQAAIAQSTPSPSFSDEPTYIPSEDEPFMNPRQLHFFKSRLIAWKNQLVQESCETIHSMQGDHYTVHPDIVDQASQESERTLELRARDRERKLIMKINEALSRIEEGSYGYCEETGEPIGLKRLQARPIATLCIEAQERHERKERVHQDNWA